LNNIKTKNAPFDDFDGSEDLLNILRDRIVSRLTKYSEALKSLAAREETDNAEFWEDRFVNIAEREIVLSLEDQAKRYYQRYST
jgi:hypothetical protein